MEEPPQSLFDRAREADRVATLRTLGLLDGGSEREMDALVSLAPGVLGCTTAVITFVDDEYAWIKASTHPTDRQRDRNAVVCDHVVRTRQPLIVRDLAADERFRDIALNCGLGEPRFYAGTPIAVCDEHGEPQVIGALCVLADVPRDFTPAELDMLRQLGRMAEMLIAAQRNARAAVDIARNSLHQATALARQDRVFRQAERLTLIGSWRLSVDTHAITWSEGMCRIHDLPVGPAPHFHDALAFYPPHARGIVSASVARALETGKPFTFECDFISAAQHAKRVRCHGEVEYVDGVAAALVGVFQDITQQYRLEQQLRRSADTDALTGIANRAAFDRALPEAMQRSQAAGAPLLLALIDLDGFKAINDTFGHTAGDDVLRLVGERLRADWLAGCRAARLGGDEFAVIVDDPALVGQPARLRMLLEEAMQLSISVAGVAVLSAASVGIAALDDECKTTRDFIRKADVVLYQAKRARVGERRHGAGRVAA